MLTETIIASEVLYWSFVTKQYPFLNKYLHQLMGPTSNNNKEMKFSTDLNYLPLGAVLN